MKETTLTTLEEKGFKGLDIDLAISLYDQGFAYLLNKDGSYHLIIGTATNNDGCYYEFYQTIISPDSIKEVLKAPWFPLKEFCEYMDMVSIFELRYYFRTLPELIYYMISWAGIANVVGVPLETFKIRGE